MPLRRIFWQQLSAEAHILHGWQNGPEEKRKRPRYMLLREGDHTKGQSAHKVQVSPVWQDRLAEGDGLRY